MSFFAKPTPAPRPKTKNIQLISLLLASIFMVLVVSQLFTFEDFPGVIMQLGLPWNNEITVSLQAALLVILEVAAMPFLLFMPLSRLARIVSMIAGWLVIIWWIGIALWSNGTLTESANSALLGATIKLPVGWWALFFAGALAVLAAWTAWGMWPLKTTSKK